ncbi:MAG: YciI family protein [bacterium]
MAQFMLLLRGGEFPVHSPEEMQKVVEKYIAWADKLRQEGRHRGGEELKEGGRILSVKNGKIAVDGPYVETKEIVGGFYHFDAKDIDEATEISRACPHLGFGGSVEIREINPHLAVAQQNSEKNSYGLSLKF